MSIHYDLYASGNPLQKEEKQPLHARVLPAGTISARRFAQLVAQSNAFSPATVEGCLQAVTDELRHWLAQGWSVEVGELGHFSLSLRCDRPVLEKQEIRSPSIRLKRVNLRVNRRFRQSLEALELERTPSPHRPAHTPSVAECRQLVLHYLKQHEGMTRADFMRVTTLSQSTALRLLQRFLQEGTLRKIGSGRTVVYLRGQATHTD